jgi:hypothetical protein
MPWAIYAWPGLPQLWRQGQWQGLAAAVGFGVLLNLLLLASFVWVELLSSGWLRAGWLLALLVWSGAAGWSMWHGWGIAPRQVQSADAMFRTALGEYLQGNWFEAEQILGRLLELRPRDAEGRLMLATLLRHNGRLKEALDQLARLELLSDARNWKQEIDTERQAIAAACENQRLEAEQHTAKQLENQSQQPQAA